MSQLELEVLEKFQQLPPDAKKRVKALIAEDSFMIERIRPDGPSLSEWLLQLDHLHAQMKVNHDGKMSEVDVVGMLREIRSEEDVE